MKEGRKFVQSVVFPAQCGGRNSKGFEVLKKPVEMKVVVTGMEGARGIDITVECPYITGMSSNRCDASHPGKERMENRVACPYALELPLRRDNPNRS